MNRIREIREAAGLSTYDLARMTNTTAATISRLETEDRKLTLEWMMLIAEALQCTPADLIAYSVVADIGNEVEPADPSEAGPLGPAMASKGLKVFRVTGNSMTNAGVKPGDLIAVDVSPDAIKHGAINNGDIVLVHVEDFNATILRQWIAPNLLVTNRPTGNLAVTLSDASVPQTIIGRVIR